MVLEPMKLEYCTLWYPSFTSSSINLYWLESWPLILEYMKLEYCVSSTRVHQTRVSICIGPWSGKSCPLILESIKLEYWSVCGPNFWSVKIMHFYVHFHEVLAYCCTFKIFTSIWFFSEHFFFFLISWFWWIKPELHANVQESQDTAKTHETMHKVSSITKDGLYWNNQGDHHFDHCRFATKNFKVGTTNFKLILKDIQVICSKIL